MKTKVERTAFPLRFMISALLLVCQLILLFVLLYTLSSKFFLIWLLSEVTAVVTVVFILTRRFDDGYKFAWIILILIFPFFGIAVYFLWGSGRLFPLLRRRMTECESHYLSFLSRDGTVLADLRRQNAVAARQAEYLMRESGFPLYRDTAVEFFAPGEHFFPLLLKELQAAKRFIFLEFYILADGEMWHAIHTLLRQKQTEGVEVRILFDDFGSVNRQQKNLMALLRQDGLQVASFNRIHPAVNLFMNNRDHRKMIIIDGELAVMGGFNIGDEYINRIRRFGYWMDCAVFLRGSAAQSFAVMFCTLWTFSTKEKIRLRLPKATPSPDHPGFCLPYCDGPLSLKNPAEGIYLQILHTAQRYVYLTSPYLILNRKMIAALCMAVKSGVDVRILTPHIPDKPYVHAVTQYNYGELSAAGVRIYEYTPGFIHSKLFVSDDRVATVGTVNMDYRSFLLHFECGVWLSESQTVLEIRRHFEGLLTQSRETNWREWKKCSLYERIKRAVLHLFSPFL
ncbi:MAG: cardiolipin synthase [Clostridia bacterium]|nr:cardiolipin synthase [Clostridia bacterium]